MSASIKDDQGPAAHELTADDVVNEDVIRAYYLQPFMLYLHANVVINLLTWLVDYRNGWKIFQSEFNFARAGTLIIDFYWLYYFHRYLRVKGRKPPVQSDVTLLIVSLGMSLIAMHYLQWLMEVNERSFHYSGLLGAFNYVVGLYYTHFYLAKLIHWKHW